MTDAHGKYRLEFLAYPQAKVRIDALKHGFCNGTFPITLVSGDPKTQYYSKDFILESPAQTADIDTAKDTISGTGTSTDADGFVVQTRYSVYHIAKNALVHANGSPYVGHLTGYFFEFNKHSQTQDLLQNDIFDDVVGYAGNLMKTFGMPYVLFVADNGERIHILKSNPMLLRTSIQEMTALTTGSDHIYGPVTTQDFQSLMDASKKLGGFPINRQYLIDHQMLRFPAFWDFDQAKGTWVNIETRVVSLEGTVETQFYTISKPLSGKSVKTAE